MTLPRVTLEGGVVIAPELAFSSAGKPWVRLRVACNDRKRGTSGEWEDGPTTFINVVAFGRQAENLAESVAVGDTIMAAGRLEMREWEDDKGQHTTYQIVADEVGVSMLWGAAKTERVLRDTKPTPAPDPWATAD